MEGTNVYDCPRCGPVAAWEPDLAGWPSCGHPCQLTHSAGARLQAWGRVVSVVVGNLECVVSRKIAVDAEDLDQLAQLADWLHEEGAQQQAREATPPLRLIKSA